MKDFDLDNNVKAGVTDIIKPRPPRPRSEKLKEREERSRAEFIVASPPPLLEEEKTEHPENTHRTPSYSPVKPEKKENAPRPPFNKSRRFGGLQKREGPPDRTKKKSHIIYQSQEALLWAIAFQRSDEYSGLMVMVRKIFDEFIQRPENQKAIRDLKRDKPEVYEDFCRAAGWQDS